MKLYYTIILLFLTSIVGSEISTHEEILNLKSFISLIASITSDKKNSPKIISDIPQTYNLLNSEDIPTLLEASSLREGDKIRLKRPPQLKIPHSYTYIGVAENNPRLITDPNNSSYTIYTLRQGFFNFYHQYQQCENGIMQIPETDFSEVEVIARDLSEGMAIDF